MIYKKKKPTKIYSQANTITSDKLLPFVESTSLASKVSLSNINSLLIVGRFTNSLYFRNA